MSIKIAKALKLSSVGRYPQTAGAILDKIPSELIAALTARHLAVVLDLAHTAYIIGTDSGWSDAVTTYGVKVGKSASATKKPID